MKEVKPITRASFLEAYADEHPYNECRNATDEWDDLHERKVFYGEIDEDPAPEVRS